MLLIDTFNVLHRPEAVHLGRALGVADLARMLGRGRYAGRRAVLVCDGTGGGVVEWDGAPGVEIVFSGRDHSADDEIEARLRRTGGHGVVVVSEDRMVCRAAARAGARSLPSGVFLRHLLADNQRKSLPPVPRFARDIPLDRSSVAHWMRVFGLSPESLLERKAGKAEASRPVPPKAPPREQPSRADRPEHAAGEGAPRPGTGAPERNPDPRVLRMESLADDPVIREALEAWRGRLTLDDLDMARWLGEHPPGGGGPDGQR